MATLKYKLIPAGAAEGRVPINLIFIDKKDVVANGLTYREACEVMAKNFKEPAAIDIMDMDAITVTSDGIVVDYAIVAFASIDYGMINKDFGFLSVTEQGYSEKLLAEEPHMKQWNGICHFKAYFIKGKPFCISRKKCFTGSLSFYVWARNIYYYCRAFFAAYKF